MESDHIIRSREKDLYFCIQTQIAEARVEAGMVLQTLTHKDEELISRKVREAHQAKAQLEWAGPIE